MTESEIKRDNRWRLNSPAAADIRWFCRCAGADMGFSASRFEMPAETVRHPDRFECRKCGKLSPGGPGSKCRGCGAPLLDFDRVMPNPTRPPASPATTDKPDRVLAATAKERRIRAGLVRMRREVAVFLLEAYTARQHTPEMRRALGDFADLAMRGAKCQAAYGRYVEACAEDGEKPLELEVWLTKRCREKGKADGGLTRWREDTEHAVCDALEEYQRVRIPPGASSTDLKLRRWADMFNGGEVPRVQSKRRSPLERVREAIERERGR